MSGFEGDLSPRQQAALDQLKKNLKDIRSDTFTDYYLLRWLRARSFDVKKSEKMLRDSLDWRVNNGIDNILKWKVPEVIQKYYPGGFFGQDKQGNPTWIDILGYVDLKGMFYSSTKRDLVRYRIYKTEEAFQVKFPELSKKYGRRIDKINMIFDMDKIGMKHVWKPAVDSFIDLIKTVEANYPETLRVTYVVNAPLIFPMLYNLVKPFLSEDTKRKIRILGGSWKEELLKDFDADQLPVHWGGTSTDPDGDEYCRSQVCLGGTIPEEYRKSNVAENFDMSNFTTAVVQRGSDLQVETQVTKAGSILRFNFWTEGKDIGFGIFRSNGQTGQKTSSMEAIMPSERVNSHIVPEDGSVVCEKAGTYVTVFDNTYSWVNTKKISYLLEVIDPELDSSVQKHASVTHF